MTPGALTGRATVSGFREGLLKESKPLPLYGGMPARLGQTRAIRQGSWQRRSAGKRRRGNNAWCAGRCFSQRPSAAWSGTFFEVSVDARKPGDASRYESFLQDGVRIFYSPKLVRKSATLELDNGRVLFRSRPMLTGPEELVAAVVMGRV